MPEESTTPDPVELGHRSLEALNQGDLDAVMGAWGPDPVWDLSPMGLGVYEGKAAIRAFFEDWIGAYEEYEIKAEETLDLGSGITFAVAIQKGRPVGSDGHVQWRYASITEWVDGMAMRVTNYADIDEARAEAERLAESRAQS